MSKDYVHSNPMMGNILSLRSFFAVHNQIQLIYTLAVEIHTDM